MEYKGGARKVRERDWKREGLRWSVSGPLSTKFWCINILYF